MLEQLQAVLDAGDAQGCLALFRTATEAVRRSAAAAVEKRLREQWDEPWTTDGKRHPRLTTAQVAALATCSLSQLKKFGWRAFPDDDIVLAVFKDRRPTWLDDWALMALEINPRHMPVVRLLVREGLCRRPDHDNYWLGLLDRFSATMGGRMGAIYDTLAGDPALRDEVWRLFEIDGNGEFSLAACDKYTKDEWSWATALMRLSQEGKLARARLLDASLDTLSRDFAQFRAGWFSRFHETLKPTIDERVERADRYLTLLASKIPPTVSFALGALKVLDKAGRLAPTILVANIGPAMLARSKGTVVEALKLLDRAAEREPSTRDEVLHAVVPAIRHESPEVQGAVLGLLERHGSPADAALVEAVRTASDGVAASQRKRLQAWLGDSKAKAAKPISKGKSTPAADGARDLLARAGKVDATLAHLAGVDEAVAAVKAGAAHVPAVEFSAMDIPHLHADRAIVPIADLDELIDCFAAVLENANSPDDIERVLDGVSRLCGQRPDDFARRTGPLAKRAETLLKRRWGGAFVGTGPVPDLCGLAIAWTRGEMPAPTGQRLANEAKTVLKFLAARVRALAERACQGVAQPLLAAPTHQGAWIDARVLVERVRGWPDPAVPADRLDEVQALLRLAPDHRADALRKSAKLPGEFGAALRYALGGKESKIGPTAALWIAAARARAPRADDPAVGKHHAGLGPDAGQTARLDLTLVPREKFKFFRVAVEPALPRQVPLEFPTVLLHAGARVTQYFATAARWDAPSVRWAGSIWPLCRDAWFAAGALLIGGNLDWWEAEWGNRTYLEPLLDPDVPLTPMATTLLVLGLAAKEPGESGLATDALIAAIDDGRLDGSKLGTRMAALLATGQIKVTRWAKTLADAARIATLHAAVIALALERTLQELPDPPPRDLQALLELLRELLIAQSSGLTLPAARGALNKLNASGKTGKLIQELLALQSTAAPAQDIAVRALTGRLQRAERWASGSKA